LSAPSCWRGRSRGDGSTLLLNSVNINFIAFGRYDGDFRGQIFAIFVIAITAAEVAVALGILVALVRNKSTLKVDDVTMMKG
jgi:NADH-quinone oxidoreductase subunit K